MLCLGFANPWQYYIAEQSSYKANDYTKAQYGNDGVINGHHDAFRHAIWNGLMTRDLRDGYRILRLGIIIFDPHFAFGNTHY